MKTIVEGNRVSINDEVVVEFRDGIYKVRDSDVWGVELQLPSEPKVSDHDPVYYSNHANGLTIEDSAHRAASKIDMDFDEWGDQISEYTDVYDACETLIRKGEGRHTCYRIAGGIVKGVKEGLYKGLPLSLVFKAYVDGKIETPVDDNNVSSGSYAVKTPYRLARSQQLP